jgi:hypothetical protein
LEAEIKKIAAAAKAVAAMVEEIAGTIAAGETLEIVIVATNTYFQNCCKRYIKHPSL